MALTRVSTSSASACRAVSSAAKRGLKSGSDWARRTGTAGPRETSTGPLITPFAKRDSDGVGGQFGLPVRQAFLQGHLPRVRLKIVRKRLQFRQGKTVGAMRFPRLLQTCPRRAAGAQAEPDAVLDG